MPIFLTTRVSGGLRQASGGLRQPLALAIIWVLCILLVNPLGDFPLNDDWAYGQNVQNLVVEGRLYFEDWLVMTLVGQVFWGALFCVVFGFSFTVLRFSTLVIALAGIGACYACLKEVNKNDKLAFFGTLLILFNPWFFSLSFSFMTDVPFFSTFMLSQLFFLKALKKNSTKNLLLGTFFALFSTLIRQWGLLAPFVFGLVYVLKNRNGRSLMIGFLPLLITFLGMMGFIEWLDARQGVSEHYGRPGLLFDRLLQVQLWESIKQRSGIFLFYWGLCLLPVSCLFLSFEKKRRPWFSAIVGILSAGLVMLMAIPCWDQIPNGNILYNVGLGPKLLKDGHYGLNIYPSLSLAFWNIIKVVGFAGAWLLVWQAIEQLISFPKSIKEWDLPIWYKVVAILTLSIFTGYLLIDYYYWDRYYLLALPFWLILIFPTRPKMIKKWIWVIGSSLLLLIALFSLSATHDYLSWNRARWNAIEMLTEQNLIPPKRIDGGFEFNAYHKTGPRNPVSRYGKSWWFVEEDEYVVAFGPIACYEKTGSFSYQRWMPPGRDSIWVLRRALFDQVDTIKSSAEIRSLDKLDFYTSREDIFLGNGSQQDSTYAHSGRYSLKLSPEQPYGFTLRLDDVRLCERLSVSFWRFAKSGDPRAGVVFSSPDAQQLYEFQNQPVQEEKEGWQLFHHEISVPPDHMGNELMIYIWNPRGNETVWVDEVEIIRKKSSR